MSYDRVLLGCGEGTVNFPLFQDLKIWPGPCQAGDPLWAPVYTDANESTPASAFLSCSSIREVHVPHFL